MNTNKEWNRHDKNVYMQKHHKHITSAKRISTAIRRAKRVLVAYASANGMWENFGQDLVRLIDDAYIDISSYTDKMNANREDLQKFNEWCMNLNTIMNDYE